MKSVLGEFSSDVSICPCHGHLKDIFHREANSRFLSDKISFYSLETEKTTFFAKNLVGKCQISNSRGPKASPSPPPSDYGPCPNKGPQLDMVDSFYQRPPGSGYDSA